MSVSACGELISWIAAILQLWREGKRSHLACSPDRAGLSIFNWKGAEIELHALFCKADEVSPLKCCKLVLNCKASAHPWAASVLTLSFCPLVHLSVSTGVVCSPISYTVPIWCVGKEVHNPALWTTLTSGTSMCSTRGKFLFDKVPKLSGFSFLNAKPGLQSTFELTDSVPSCVRNFYFPYVL